jgi:HK97 family phage major capsid protein
VNLEFKTDNPEAPSMVEVKAAIEDLGRTFEEFKKVNDEELAEIKKKGHGDPLLASQVEKINAELARVNEVKERLDDLEKKANRLNAGGGGADQDAAQVEHKAAFNSFMRKGNDDGLLDLERKALETFLGKKAMSTIPAEDGGFALPITVDRNILNLMQDVSEMRQIANVVTIGGGVYKKLVNVHGVNSGWVGETSERPETDTSKLKAIEPSMGEVYAFPFATQGMLDDGFFDVEGWLASELATEFAIQEGAAFFNGNGIDRPRGLLTYPVSTKKDGSRDFGTIQYIKTGVNGGFKALNASTGVSPADDLIDIIHALRKAYRNGGRFLCNGTTYATMRKFKDNDGNYIWQAGLQAGQPSVLLGYPVSEDEEMPDLATDSLSVGFGNIKLAYTIVDRIGTRTLRDPYTKKPYVGFYTTKRVGGSLVNSEAVKFLKFSS